MHIECSVQEDLKALLDLQKLAYQSEAELCNDYTIPPLTQTYESICEDFSNMEMLKAVDENDNIVGSVRAYEKKESAISADFMCIPITKTGVSANY